MDHFIEIYKNQTHAYHKMINCEDFENNLLKTILQFAPITARKVLDLGSGTGRMPLLFKELKPDLVALDISFQMLVEQQIQMQQVTGNWSLAQGDIRHLPIRDAWADVTTAGWAAGHFCGWYPDTWQEEIDRFIHEMQRVTKPFGQLFIMETLGTGKETPAPPTQAHTEYYERIEAKWGFQREVIRTDYRFQSLEDAKKNTTFFFGQELAEQIDQKEWKTLPEWTGVWHRMNQVLR